MSASVFRMREESILENERWRILIADDEPIERMVVSKTIQNHFGDEIELWQAVNGREAIEIFRKRKIGRAHV